MSRPALVAQRRAGAVAATVLAALAVLVVLGAWLHGRESTGFDDWCAARAMDWIGHGMSEVLLGFSDPPLDVFAVGVVAVCAAFARRWDIATLAVVAPVLATVLTEFVGKPLVGRHFGGAYAFPSGHETGVSAAALVLAVAIAQLPLSRRAQVIWRVGLTLWVLTAGVGLVRAHYHYATDVIGAIALSAVVVLGGALLIDRIGARARRPQLI